VDNRDEVRAFLSSRRAKVTPEQAGVAIYGRNRRVPGLRRSEVADLAGVSVEYYAQLERGDLAGASETVLDALGRALHLSEAEREHLRDLARAAGPARRARRRPAARQVRPSVARILDGMTEVPAFVENGRLAYLLERVEDGQQPGHQAGEDLRRVGCAGQEPEGRRDHDAPIGDGGDDIGVGACAAGGQECAVFDHVDAGPDHVRDTGCRVGVRGDRQPVAARFVHGRA